MKKISLLLIIVLVLIADSSAYALSKSQTDALLSKLATQLLGQDFRIKWKFKKNVAVCGGGQADAYIGQVEMNTHTPGYGQNGSRQVNDNWHKIGKSYSVFVEELAKDNPQIVDNDTCME